MYKAKNKELILIYNIYLKQNICEKKSFHLWLEQQYDLIKNLPLTINKYKKYYPHLLNYTT
jgi:hypothetical protein